MLLVSFLLRRRLCLFSLERRHSQMLIDHLGNFKTLNCLWVCERKDVEKGGGERKGNKKAGVLMSCFKQHIPLLGAILSI